MKTATDILREYGLPAHLSGHGRHYWECPRCSDGRSRAHQHSKCLAVTVDEKGIRFFCNHCEWSGGEYYNGKANGHANHNKYIAIYDYVDETGTPLFQVCRKADKTFPQRKPDGKGGWIYKTADVRKVLYRLPELIEAIASERRIVIVEGEKDVESLRKIGVPATCNPGGASKPDKATKWRPEYSELLRGADIVVVPDNDGPGHAHADAIVSMSTGIAKSIRRLDLAKHWPQCPPNGDISDWLAAGHTREQLDTLIEQAPICGSAFPAIITLDAWLKRDLPSADPILGHWLTTTSRVLLNAPTGIGKTMLGIAIIIAIPACTGFLHWNGTRQARTLLIDGEMSRRLLTERLVDEARRAGVTPPGAHILSHEDVEGFAPLNTPEGQAFIERFIQHIGGVDLIVFDNIMSLVAGDQKDEEGWRAILPWARSLTRRNIGQLWLHHTGHDETRGYGTKTREWQMDTVIHLEKIERPDTDVSFLLSFRKARERTPTTRADFEDVKIALVEDAWISSRAEGTHKQKVSPLARKFLEALQDAAADTGEADKMFSCPTASLERWRAECVKRGLIGKEKDRNASAMFSKYKVQLIAANQVVCNDAVAWISH
jgi:AAA domain